MSNTVLFVSPSADDASTVSEMLSRAGIHFVHVRNLGEARSMLERRSFGAVLTEARLPDGGWQDVIRLVGRMKGKLAVVVTDMLADARFWVDVLESGAYDLLPKPFCSGEVQRILGNAVDQPTLLMREIAVPAA